jgi:hypothetical protein
MCIQQEGPINPLKIIICPKSSTNLRDFKTCFFSLQNVAISKLFLFPSWKCGDLVFFLGIFQNACFTMYVFMGDFSTDFPHKK